MKEKALLILEARVNIDGVDDACNICGLHKERIRGATGTYIAGTQLWVCAECALCIDGELASFAYNPDHRVTRKRRSSGDIFDQYFGLCPECGQCDARKNIGRGHWCYCARHGLKWHAGENVLGDWREESMDDWYQNFLFLERFRLCDGWFPEPNRCQRIIQRLRTRKDKLLRPLRAAVCSFGPPELPF